VNSRAFSQKLRIVEPDQFCKIRVNIHCQSRWNRECSAMGLRSSIRALLGRDMVECPDSVFHGIRTAMLCALEEHCGETHFDTQMDITFASNLSQLWYLRPNLMKAIAACQDDAAAQAVLQKITALFRGYYASANASKFGSL
jgi:hypothetical protein